MTDKVRHQFTDDLYKKTQCIWSNIITSGNVHEPLGTEDMDEDMDEATEIELL